MKMITKMVPFDFFLTDEGETIPLYELKDMIEALENTDGFVSALVVHDKDMKKFLLEHGIAKETARGRIYEGPNYESWTKKFQSEMKAFVEKKWKQKNDTP